MRPGFDSETDVTARNNNMKTKITLLSILGLIAALWACWLLAYQRGYAQGARDANSGVGKPMPVAIDGSWDGKLIARRDMGLLPGGQRFPKWAPIRNEPANNVPAYNFPR